MSDKMSNQFFGGIQLALIIILVIIIALFLQLRVSWQSKSSMEQLASRSLPPEVALSNGIPTMIEFYAEWCQVCREMSPDIKILEEGNRGKLNIVLLNVDNPRWLDLMEKYEVNGIPQINLFSADGQHRGKSIGLRRSEELQNLANALIHNNPLPKLQGIKVGSAIQDTYANSQHSQAGPRSHI